MAQSSIPSADVEAAAMLGARSRSGFRRMGLIPAVFRGVTETGYAVPSKIQRKSIPLILAGADVVAVSPTGSGKTAAFLVPMIQKLREHVPGAGVRALILSPTRDSAIQTLKFTKELGRYTDLRAGLFVGGDSMEHQFDELALNPDVIIATPDGLMNDIIEAEGISLRTVEYVVLDEADSLLSMGFAEQLQKILLQLSETRQTLVFGATLPKALAEVAKASLRDPKLVSLDEAISSDHLSLAFFTVHPDEKVAALLYLIREQIGLGQQTMIFVSTKYHVQFLNALFRKDGIESSMLHSDMDQDDRDARKISISNFRDRKTMVLIVTDVAARGIDIPFLDNVVNWDFPLTPKSFVHRVGRVARAGWKGMACSFVTPEDMPYLLDLHLFLSKPLRPAPTEEEVLQDMEGVHYRINLALANGETVYGRFPQNVIDHVSDRVREIIDGCTEVIKLQKLCAKASHKYTESKARCEPSTESIQGANDLPREGLHPMFTSSLLRSHKLTALAFSDRLKI